MLFDTIINAASNLQIFSNKMKMCEIIFLMIQQNTSCYSLFYGSLDDIC